jgi:hypothetical protein
MTAFLNSFIKTLIHLFHFNLFSSFHFHFTFLSNCKVIEKIRDGLSISKDICAKLFEIRKIMDSQGSDSISSLFVFLDGLSFDCYASSMPEGLGLHSIVAILFFINPLCCSHIQIDWIAIGPFRNIAWVEELSNVSRLWEPHTSVMAAEFWLWYWSWWLSLFEMLQLYISGRFQWRLNSNEALRFLYSYNT